MVEITPRDTTLAEIREDTARLFVRDCLFRPFPPSLYRFILCMSNCSWSLTLSSLPRCFFLLFSLHSSVFHLILANDAERWTAVSRSLWSARWRRRWIDDEMTTVRRSKADPGRYRRQRENRMAQGVIAVGQRGRLKKKRLLSVLYYFFFLRLPTWTRLVAVVV